jgi:putative YhdH/YhfP family quinone oxidoreductase
MEDVTFSALVVFEETTHQFKRTVSQKKLNQLPPGDVLVKVEYSSLNYKDALSATGNRGVTKQYPHTPGIDAAGTVVHSLDPRWTPGEQVICTGYDLGMNTSGGFSQYIRVPAGWLVKKPSGLSLLETMQLGTAGFTAALCVSALQNNGVTPSNGSILVTGATGGVGTIALMLLHHLGYQTVAVTGKKSAHAFLGSLGASTILDREAALAGQDKPLLTARWAGVIDTVGGDMLATAVKATDYDGVVTSCGNAASGDLPLNVYPFILRGVHLVGIYSANCPMARRLPVWNKLAGGWKFPELARISRLVTLNQIEEEILAMIAGKTQGRCVIDLEGKA